jgi:hypothetical protein
MRWDIIITAIPNAHIRPVAAHQIARNLNIPLQKALSTLDSLPATYARDLSDKQANEHLGQLARMQIHAKKIEARVEFAVPDRHAHIQELPESEARISPPRPATPAPAPAAHAATPPARRSLVAVDPDPPPAMPHKKNRGPAFVAKVKMVLWVGILLGGGFAASYLTCGRFTIRWNGMMPRVLPGGAVDTSIHATIALSLDTAKADSAATDTAALAIDLINGIDRKTRERSQSITDSGLAADSPQDAARFYRRAVDADRFNIRAWLGLLGSAQASGRKEKINEIRSKMKEVFGANAFAISETISRFGTPCDMSADTASCVVDYRSRNIGRDQLIDETWRMAAALHTVCGCIDMRIMARPPSGDIIVATATLEPFPATPEEYRSRATIKAVKAIR